MVLDPRFPHESEAELVDRRMAEAQARWARQDAAVAVRRAAGIPDVPCALLPAFSGGKFDPHNPVQGTRRRGNWGT